MNFKYNDLNNFKNLMSLKNAEIDIFTLNMHFVTPFTLILPASYAYEHEIKINKIDDNPKCSDVHSYAEYINFFDWLLGKEGSTKKYNDKYYPITRLDLNKYIRVSNNIVEQEAKKIANIFKENEEVIDIINYCISEILRNIPEHSESKNGWICAQKWNHHNYVEIEVAIVDYGIGLIEKTKEQYPSLNSEEIIKKVLSPGFTQSTYEIKDYEEEAYQNSGYGLYVVSNLCKKLNGEFSVLSNNSLYKLEKNKADHSIFFPSFPGTAIKIKLQIDDSLNSDELIKQIVKEGERIASNQNDRITTASKKTKSLNL